MENTTGIPKSALDFKGYGELKARAGAKDAKATKEVAQQFEAMFISDSHSKNDIILTINELKKAFKSLGLY